MTNRPVFVPQAPDLPLPGRPCRIRWLEPLPAGWAVRSDGLFFYFCYEDRLRAFATVHMPRNLLRALLMESVAAATARWADSEEGQQAYRLHAKVTAALWMHPLGRAMWAVAQSMAIVFREVVPEAEREAAVLEFIQLVVRWTGGTAVAFRLGPAPAAGDGETH